MTSRDKIRAIIETARFRNIIMGVIIFNAILLGLETSATIMANAKGLIRVLDAICLYIFIAEIGLKLYANRLAFFRSGWNIFDFLIVGIAIVPGSQGFAVLRALRVLRVLRLISGTPSLRRVVEGFLTLSLIHI